MPSLAARNEYGHPEGRASECGKCEPGDEHAIPDDLHRLGGSNDSDYLFLGRDRDCHDQLSTDLAVGDRAGGGSVHDGVSGFGAVTKPQSQTHVVNANLLFVGWQLNGIVMCEVGVDPDCRLQSRAFQLAPLIVEECGTYDRRQRYGKQQ